MIGVMGTTIPNAQDILLGEGVVYKDYGEGTSAVIGATRGGSRLSVEKPVRVIAYDGSYGPTKNMRRIEMYIVKLIINFLKLTYTNLVYGLSMTVSDGTDQDGTYKKMNFDLEIAAADVLTNVTFKGQKHSGEVTLIKVLNALNISPIKWEFKSKDEIVSEMTYTGFYFAATPTVPPLEIWDYTV